MSRFNFILYINSDKIRLSLNFIIYLQRQYSKIRTCWTISSLLCLFQRKPFPQICGFSIDKQNPENRFLKYCRMSIQNIFLLLETLFYNNKFNYGVL